MAFLHSNRFGGSNGVSDAFVESLWETLIILATTAAICVGVVSMAAHIDEARAIRDGIGNVTTAHRAADAMSSRGRDGYPIMDQEAARID